jgi:hypothetical protein
MPTPEDLLLALEANPELAAELTDADLEHIVAGKGGGGGGRGGDSVMRGFDRLNAFQNFQARSFANSGVNPGSSAFERLAGRGINLSGVGSSLRRVR